LKVGGQLLGCGRLINEQLHHRADMLVRQGRTAGRPSTTHRRGRRCPVGCLHTA
jgi:hypothetical protein